jgi:Fic family protein
LEQLAPEQLSSLKKVATIERIGSFTRIEGSKLTDREVESLLLNLSIQKFETSDKQEVAVHPFQDGNGRLSRVLTTYLLLKGGYNTSTTFVSNYSISEIERKGNYL